MAAQAGRRARPATVQAGQAGDGSGGQAARPVRLRRSAGRAGGGPGRPARAEPHDFAPLLSLHDIFGTKNFSERVSQVTLASAASCAPGATDLQLSRANSLACLVTGTARRRLIARHFEDGLILIPGVRPPVGIQAVAPPGLGQLAELGQRSVAPARRPSSHRVNVLLRPEEIHGGSGEDDVVLPTSGGHEAVEHQGLVARPPIADLDFDAFTAVRARGVDPPVKVRHGTDAEGIPGTVGVPLSAGDMPPMRSHDGGERVEHPHPSRSTRAWAPASRCHACSTSASVTSASVTPDAELDQDAGRPGCAARFRRALGGTLPGILGSDDVNHGVDQRQVGERLGELPR